MRKKLLILAGIAIVGGIASLVRFDIPAEEIKRRHSSSESRFLPMRGVEVHYLDQGRGEVLLLLHGVSASLYAWDDWARELRRDFRIIRPDLPGSGLTGPVPGFDYRVESYIAFVHEFSERLGLRRFHLAGNSLGGGIAWGYALAHPEHVDKLILIGAIGYPVSQGLLNRLAGSRVVGCLMQYITPRFAVRATMMMIYADSSKITDAGVRRYHELILREGNRRAASLRLQNQSEDLYPARIREISQPTLLLWGAEDSSVPLKHARRFRQDIKKSRLIIYPGAGHVIMEEIPKKTARDVRLFLGIGR